MGKVRIKTIGLEETEEKQKEAAQKRKEAKKEKKLAKGAHGGERVVSMAPSEEELTRLAELETKQTKIATTETLKEIETQKVKPHLPRQHSKRYKNAFLEVNQTKTYSLPEALELLRKVGYAKFDGTVELHINTIEKGLSGNAALPHSRGMPLRVAIANETLLDKIESGKIDFDILLAKPEMMAKLARVAKILGPRGLMPNPKSGTITSDPEKLAQTLSQGKELRFKTEGQAPIIHLSVGKLSMKDQELAENIQAVLAAIGPEKIKNVTLKSTMSPGIRINFN